MRVLVAGAYGYLGFCLSMRLANNGFDVVGVHACDLACALVSKN